MIFVFSQIIGLIAFIILAFSYWQKDRRKILLLEVAECLLYSVHYFMLGATTGGFLNIIGSVRSGSFIYKDKNKFMSTNALPIIFMFVYILNAALTWEGIITIFPTMGSMIFCIAIWQHNTKVIRRYGIIVQLLWLIYAISIGSYVAMLSQVILMGSTAFAVVKLDILKIKTPDYKIKINTYLNALEKIYDSNNQNFVYDKQAIKNPEYIKFVCFKGNKPVGYTAVYPHSDFMEKQGFPKYEQSSPFSVFIWHIVVRKGYERKGVATNMLEEIKKVYNGFEIYSVMDSRNNPSVLFHNTKGFTKKSDFQRVYFGKLEKFDLMQLKPHVTEIAKNSSIEQENITNEKLISSSGQQPVADINN